jgi:hypothetical protein
VGHIALRKPSAALVISIIALVLAASGTAVAASKLVSGNSLIKQGSLSGNRLKSHTLTGKQIDLSALGTVPNATDATKATTATTAGSAPISTVTYVTSTVNTTATPSTAEEYSLTPVIASCPTGTVVIGGGASVSSEADEAVNDSSPSGRTGWSATIVDASTQSLPATVTAICAPAAATAP